MLGTTAEKIPRPDDKALRIPAPLLWNLKPTEWKA